MGFDILAVLSDGTTVFQGHLNYVPRKGEEIDVNGYLLVVENIRYILKEGTTYANQVQLQLARVKE